MIALSAYKLANYLADIAPTGSYDVKWSDLLLNDLVFAQAKVSRNNCFFSTAQSGQDEHSYFFKQPISFLRENIQDFRNEHTVYRLVKNHFSSMKDFMPELIGFDDYNCILITRYFKKAEALGMGGSGIYEDAGKYLSTYHNTFTKKKLKKLRSSRKLVYEKNLVENFKNHKPWFLSLTQEDIYIIKRKGVKYLQLVYFLIEKRDLLKSLSQIWDSETKGLIHGDATSNNFIQYVENGKQVIKIIDFEFVSYGCWLWDLSIFVASLLSESIVPGTCKNGGDNPNDTYRHIRLFCIGYFQNANNITEEKIISYQKTILLLAGIYFLQRFANNEKEDQSLENGLVLISENEACWKIIFNTP